jgi:sugar (pentulose or hexulose) kinase
MSRDLIIGIDSSTSATKAIAWDGAGRAVAEARVAIALRNPAPGHFEQDPADWWNSTAGSLKKLTAEIDADRIAAVGISNQRETFGFFTEDGEALRPGMVWLDERAKTQQRRFGETFGAERVHAISGKPIDVIPPIYRMIWMAEREPEIFARAARITEVHGYLTFRLTQNWTTSTASADPMGALDMRTRQWSQEILDAIGVRRAQMLDLAPPGTGTGTITPAAAEATGLPVGLPVIAGGGDGQCAGTGAGVSADHPSRAYVNLGTAVVSGCAGGGYVHNRAFRTEIAVADRGYVYETCMRSGTFLVDWLAQELLGGMEKRDLLAALEREAAKSPIGANGVMVVPYWQGCMTPYWDSSARGIIAGLSGSTKRGDIYRAFLEGVALEQATSTANVARATGVPIDHFVAIGGGAASDFWVQIFADATGLPVHRAETVEASSLGAAIAAAKGIGWYETIAAATAAMARRPARTFEPDAARAARYAELRAFHAELWPKLASWNERVVGFAERI